ncbi:uncharacterized protein [Amphiura filiformis]|uniref:uncharacterized protein n=1 Tax=Amphiura filiformis TaxID=82378 RepID=UPI003B228F8B
MNAAYYTLLVFNILIFIIGVPGNIIILLVYGGKRPKLSSHIFIIGLAFADLFISSVRPIAIFNWKHDILCQITLTSSYIAMFSSIFLTTSIACDRYLAVCTKRKLTTFKAMIIVSGCIFIAILISGVSFTTFGLVENPGQSSKTCGITESKSWALQFQVMLFSISFISSLGIIIVLYVLIYRVVRRQAKIQASWTSTSNRQATGNLSVISPSCTSAVSDASVVPGRDSSSNSCGTVSNYPDGLQRGSSSQELLPPVARAVQQSHESRAKKSKPGPKAQNRTTKMMFLTTAVYFVSWIPGIVLRFVPDSTYEELQKRNPAWQALLIVPHYLVLINHAVNPFIYSFVNRRFREDCHKVFARLRRKDSCRKLQTVSVSVLLDERVPGNIIILLVYGGKRPKLSSHIFIIGLAFADLFISSVRPIAIFNWKHDILCQITLTSSYIAMFSSIFLTTSIACDRYLAVCTKRKLTTFKAMIIVSGCIFIAILISGVSFTTFGLVENPGQSSKTCGITESKSWALQFQVMLFSISFISSLGIIIVLYVLIYRVVRRQAKIQASWTSTSNRQATGNLSVISPSCTSAVSDASVVPGGDSSSNSCGTVSNHPDGLQRGSSSQELLPPVARAVQQTHESRAKKSKPGPTAQNRTTKMMFLTTAVYFVSWIPGIVLRFVPDSTYEELQKRNPAWQALLIVPHYLVLINHAVNPFIYSFVNRRFREDCHKVFARLRRVYIK